MSSCVIYVDSSKGDDRSAGTESKPLKTLTRVADLISGRREDGPVSIRIAPGVYALDRAAVFEGNKSYTRNERLTIEALYLPGDPEWTPDLMPVVLSTERPEVGEDHKGPVEAKGLQVEMNHVTIRGLKFLGSPVSGVWYYPVFRGGMDLRDLVVTQCLFVSERYTTSSNVAVIAHGHELIVDHCVFHNCRNSVVFWNAEGGTSRGNVMRHCIVDGCYTSCIWVCQTAEDLEFHHNVITNCEYFFMRDADNKRCYRLEDCLITDCRYYAGVAAPDYSTSVAGPEIVFEEKNVVREGHVILVEGRGLDAGLPKSFLHVIPRSPGSDIDAGLFTGRT
ncbi:MAG: right-handed parallel beta-helix repeat-containing protein [Candidatus Eisenbacteria bacterium]